MTCSACSRCGAGADAEVAWSDEAQAVICERCYCKQDSSRYQRPAVKPRRLSQPKPIGQPEWTVFRLQIFDQMARRGFVVYTGSGRLVGCCPVCGAGLGVRFHGRTPVADFVCHDGCGEREVVAWLGRRHSGGDL